MTLQSDVCLAGAGCHPEAVTQWSPELLPRVLLSSAHRGPGQLRVARRI